MAHFRATIEGNRGEASRLGSKASGLHVTANGWNVGITVDSRVNDKGEDVFTIYATSGSGYDGRKQEIAEVWLDLQSREINVQHLGSQNDDYRHIVSVAERQPVTS